MYTDFSHPHTRSQFPCSDSNWDRCVKRKHNDGSGKLLQGHTMAKTEGGNCSFSCDAAWGIMPSITNVHKAAIPLATRSSATSLQENQRCSLSGSFSNKGTFPLNPHFIVENELSYLLDSADHCRQTPYIQNDERVVLPRKRFHMAMGVEALPGAVQTFDKDKENEALRLKEALQFEKRALRKLYRDLADERCASSTAVDEAMAMIRRLQEEKAAALVEHRWYKHASEEREAYNQEAIGLLKEALSIKEHEYLCLQDHIENFRAAIRGMFEMTERDRLECGEESAQLLCLEGKEPVSCSLMASKCTKVDLDEGCVREDRELYKSLHWHHYPPEESLLQERIYEDVETNLQRDHSHSDTLTDGQDLDDVSKSNLARIAHLEERFACLGQNQALDCESLEPALQSEGEDCGKQDTGSKSIDSTDVDVLNFAQFRSIFVAGSCKELEDLKGPVFESPTTDYKHEHCLSAPNLNDTRSREYPVSLEKPSGDWGPSCLEIVDAACEGVHELHEMQCKLDDSAMPSFCYTNKNNERGFRVRECSINHSEQGFENEGNGLTSVSRHHFPLENDTVGYDASMNNPIAAEIFSGDDVAVKSPMTGEDLQHLKLRLQALERGRAFMKEAIESLRKENTELKLLEEIANQLQELKVSGCRDQLPFLSFFKGILSFTGIQSLSSSQGGRWQGNLQTSPNKQELGGLLHLLNNSLGKENTVCVTRERKVKLGTT